MTVVNNLSKFLDDCRAWGMPLSAGIAGDWLLDAMLEAGL